MANGFIKNVFNKYFSKMNPLRFIKVSMTIIAILIYIWFFCLIAILYDIYRETFHKVVEISPINSLYRYTIGSDQPVAFIPATIFDKIIFSKALSSTYAICFGFLTLLILVFLIAWFIIKSIIFFRPAAYQWPFDELVDVFKIILLESPFTNFAITNLLRLLKIFLSLFKKKEKFKNKPNDASKMRLSYEIDKKYITEMQKNLYNKAKQHYEKKDTYMVDVMKIKEHTTNAIILKNLLIITTENDIGSTNIENTAMTFEVSIKIATKV